MTTNTLDQLIKSFQLTASNAHDKIEQRQYDRLRSVINADQNGEPEFITWECKLPSGDGGERRYEILRVPWASLYPPEGVEITEVSMEFGCDIKNLKRKKTGSQAEYLITPVSHKRAKNNEGHTLKLVARTSNEFIPESTIDEQPIGDYLDRLDALSSNEKKWYSPESKITRLIYLLLLLLIIGFTIIFFTKN